MIRFRPVVVRCALVLLLALSACATAVDPAPDPYREVNRSLRGERVIVELSGGEFAAGVTEVHLSEIQTSWIEEGRTRRVATEEVSRLIVVSHPRRSPAGLFLLLGLGLSLAFDDPLPFAVAVDVALDSFVWGAEVTPAVGRVVYPGTSGTP